MSVWQVTSYLHNSKHFFDDPRIPKPGSTTRQQKDHATTVETVFPWIQFRNRSGNMHIEFGRFADKIKQIGCVWDMFGRSSKNAGSHLPHVFGWLATPVLGLQIAGFKPASLLPILDAADLPVNFIVSKASWVIAVGQGFLCPRWRSEK